MKGISFPDLKMDVGGYQVQSSELKVKERQGYIDQLFMQTHGLDSSSTTLSIQWNV